jgi:hypothetical protein
MQKRNRNHSLEKRDVQKTTDICSKELATSCGTTKCKFRFFDATKGGDLVESINNFSKKIKLPWAKFPGEMHIPGMNFAGPGTNLDKRLTSTDMYQEWSKPVDRVDNAAYHHDLAYKYLNDSSKQKFGRSNDA